MRVEHLKKERNSDDPQKARTNRKTVYENATYCSLFGDETRPYVHYDNGNTDYFGVDPTAKFTGKSCFGAHPGQITPQEAESIGLNRFEANMAMLFAIIEGMLK